MVFISPLGSMGKVLKNTLPRAADAVEPSRRAKRIALAFLWGLVGLLVHPLLGLMLFLLVLLWALSAD